MSAKIPAEVQGRIDKMAVVKVSTDCEPSRDLKEYFGVAAHQCYLHTAIHRFVHLACLAFCVYRLIQLAEDNQAWLPPVPKGVALASFALLRQGLQRFIWGGSYPPSSANC